MASSGECSARLIVQCETGEGVREGVSSVDYRVCVRGSNRSFRMRVSPELLDSR